MSLEKLTQFLETSKNWSRFKTSVPGVFVLKLPAYRRAPPRLAVELNPVDKKGKLQKRRGLVLRAHSELEDVNALFQYEKLTKLMKMLDAVNPQPETDSQRKREEVIQL